MTTLHNRPTRSGAHRGLNAVGTFLVALPLLGGVAGFLVALTGRFGAGPENALTAAWYIPAAMAASALAGAAILLILHRHDRWLRPMALWSALGVGGWIFAMGSAQVTGLAHSDTVANEALAKAVVLLGIGIYLLALVGLTVVGVRAGSPPEDDSG